METTDVRPRLGIPAQPPEIGGWIGWRDPPFAGLVVRMSLEELQQPEIGRKFARKDKRPLDPPPVAALRCFHLAGAGTDHAVQQELAPLSESQCFEFICHIDLFLVDTQTQEGTSSRVSQSAHSPQSSSFSLQENISPSSSRSDNSYIRVNNRGGVGGPEAYQPYNDRGSPSYTPVPHLMDASRDERVQEHWTMRERDGLIRQSARFPESPELEYGKCTNLLYGELFVPCAMVDHEGKSTPVFVFSDIAVRQEGRYRLRYRIFNIAGAMHGGPSYNVPILAECYGGAFEVYSTKSFPGLQASTNLTKRISLSGIRVNSRHRERPGTVKKARLSPPDETSGRVSTQSSSPDSSMVRTSGQLPMNMDSGWTQTRPFALGFPSVDSLSYAHPSLPGMSTPASTQDASRTALAAWARSTAYTAGN